VSVFFGIEKERSELALEIFTVSILTFLYRFRERELTLADAEVFFCVLVWLVEAVSLTVLVSTKLSLLFVVI
jgi:hypothetical protein